MTRMLLAQFASKISQLEQNINGQEKGYLTFGNLPLPLIETM